MRLRERSCDYHGAVSRNIEASAVRARAEDPENAHYVELSVPEDCTDSTTDSPTVTTSLERCGRKHSIVQLGNGCASPVLAALEQRIDEFAGSPEWITCPPDDHCRDR